MDICDVAIFGKRRCNFVIKPNIFIFVNQKVCEIIGNAISSRTCQPDKKAANRYQQTQNQKNDQCTHCSYDFGESVEMATSRIRFQKPHSTQPLFFCHRGFSKCH
jgi:hypothetical protein